MINTEFNVGDTLKFDVSSQHVEYVKMVPAWEKCRDAIEGGVRIKDKGESYLPKLNAKQTDADYQDYRNRAYWYGATGKTVGTFLSMIFRRAPSLEFFQIEGSSDVADDTKDQLHDFFGSVTSDGRSFEEVVREVVEEVLDVNRVGILEDYPPQAFDSEGLPILLSALEAEQLGQRSFTALYETEDIVNWKIEEVNNEKLPTYFVLHETRDEADPVNPFSPSEVHLFRILYLFEEESGEVVYKQALLKQRAASDTQRDNSRAPSTTYEVIEAYTPMKNGETMKRIPFWVIDADGVEFEQVETPIVYDLVELNIAHYRNSADFERELHNVSTKTAVFPGWNREEMGDPTIGGAIASPPDQKPFILESNHTSPIKDEMKEKEQRMATLGAQLLSHKTRYVESSETAQIHSRGESSTIASVARAVGFAMSEVFTFKLEWSGFENVAAQVILNTDFDEATFTAQDLTALMQLYQQGTISFAVFFYALQRMELYPPDWTKEDEINAILEDKETLQGGLGGGVSEELMSLISNIQTQINEMRDGDEEPEEEGEAETNGEEA